MTDDIRKDLSRKLQLELARVLDRETRIAAHVLGPTEIGVIMHEAAVMMARTTAATMAGHGDDEQSITRLFGVMTDSIVESINASRADGIARTIAEVKARGPADLHVRDAEMLRDDAMVERPAR